MGEKDFLAVKKRKEMVDVAVKNVTLRL